MDGKEWRKLEESTITNTAIVRCAVSKFPLKKSLRTINVYVVVRPSEEMSEKEGPEHMNKWLRRIWLVISAPVRVPALLGLCLLAVFGWFLIVISEGERQSPPLMVTGLSSCAVAMQKARAENHIVTTKNKK